MVSSHTSTRPFTAVFRSPSGGEISLPEEDPGAFKLFVLWLYKGEFSNPVSGSNGTLRTATKENIPSFFHLYIMAKKWCHTEIQKATIEAIYAWLAATGIEGQSYALTNVVHELYNGTTAESEKARFLAARQTMIIAMQCKGSSKWLDQLLEEEKTFAMDFVKESWKLVQKELTTDHAAIEINYFYT